MWRSYLTVGVRALLRSRGYTLLNLGGLSLGIAACVLILLYVQYEFSYDAALPHAADTYQLQVASRDPDTGQSDVLQQSQYVAGQRLKKDFPQVEGVVFALSGSPTAVVGGNSFRIDDALAVDGPFFDVVALPLAEGDPRTALASAGTAVVTEKEARRLFGTEKAVGRTLTLLRNGEHQDFRITGILRDLPRNSHMRFTLVRRIDPVSEFASRPEFLTGWGDIGGYNYVRLRPGSDPRAIAEAMPAWKKRNIQVPPGTPDRYNPILNSDFPLVNVRDVHLTPAEGGMTPSNSQTILLAFVGVALLVLGMACVNFINLATARAGQRAREVALRKVLGAQRRQLIGQFMGEALIITGISMLIGLAIAELLLPPLNAFLGSDIDITYFGRGSILPPAILLSAVIGLLSGLYPAMFLSRFQPAQVLKANRSSAETPGSGRLRTALVVLQAATSIGLIICTTIVYLQTLHARNADPGFRRSGLIQVDLTRQLAKQGDVVAQEAARLPGVTSAAVTALGVATGSHMGRSVHLPGQTEPVNIGNYAVSEDFFSTVGLKLLAGRLLDREREADVLSVPDSVDSAGEAALAARGGNVVVNEAAARKMGFRTPQEAIGKQVSVELFMGDGKPRVPVTIVGVVSDARFRSVREKVDDVMYRLGNDYISTLIVRYDNQRPDAVMSEVERLWKRLAPEYPISARFSEDIVRDLYKADEARARLLGLFALLALVIGCLGLYGLAAFNAERRTREIGIRKVLGARTRDIVQLLVWQFTRPVLLANLIAWPVAWWAMRDWLNGFDSRIELGPTPFVLAGIVALVIALGTVGWHAIRVARTNPIKALRYE